MNLQYLCSTPHVTVSFDSWNNWLYLEWKGALTLATAQQTCLEIAHCFLTHAYARVLSNNAGLTGVAWDVAPWLVQHFFPYLHLAGVEQLAWVHAPSVRGRELAEYTLSRLASEVTLALFADMEDAVSWLQQTRPEYVSGCAWMPRLEAHSAKLQRLVAAFEQEVAASRAAPGQAPPSG